MPTDSTFAIILAIIVVAVIYLYFSMKDEVEKKYNPLKRGRIRRHRGKTLGLHGVSKIDQHL